MTKYIPHISRQFNSFTIGKEFNAQPLFDAPLQGRSFHSDEYRFAFNGQERDDEIAGVGNINTAEFWEYDARLGRRWNCDPVSITSISSFVCFNNNPILFIDPKGDYSKLGATWRNVVNGGDGLTQSGKEWGYLKKVSDGDAGIHAVFGNNNGPNAASLAGLFRTSLLQHSPDVTLIGSLVEDIRKDPNFIANEERLKEKVREEGARSGKLGKEEYDFLDEPVGIEFGGKRGSFNPRNPSFYLKTLPTSANQLTWALRHATVFAYVQVQADGCMTIHYTIEDQFDLSARRGRSLSYNIVSHILGSIYHGVLLGTAPDVHANFDVNINKNEE